MGEAVAGGEKTEEAAIRAWVGVACSEAAVGTRPRVLERA